MCTCNAGIPNVGSPTCIQLLGVAVKGYYQSTYDKDGNINGLTEADLTPAGLTALLNDPDPLKRLYPIGPNYDMVEVTDVKEDDTDNTATGGQFTGSIEGLRTFTADIIGANNILAGQIESAKCFPVSVYFLDKTKNLIGSCWEGVEGKLNGLRVNKNTWKARYVKPIDGQLQKVAWSFTYDEDEADANISYFNASDITANFATANGLLDVDATYTDSTVNGFTMTLDFFYGDKLNKVPYTGIETADVTLFNVTDSLAVGVTSVTESATVDGEYAVIYDAVQDSADVIQPTITKNGADFSGIGTVTVP